MPKTEEKEKFVKQRPGLVTILILLAVYFLIPTKSFARQSCESLINLKLHDTIITSATAVPAGSFKLPPGSNPESLDLPAFCRVLRHD